MMALTLAEAKGQLIAIGSGGSNRLRSAILQTLVNMIDFDMTAQQAVRRRASLRTRPSGHRTRPGRRRVAGTDMPTSRTIGSGIPPTCSSAALTPCVGTDAGDSAVPATRAAVVCCLQRRCWLRFCWPRPLERRQNLASFHPTDCDDAAGDPQQATPLSYKTSRTRSRYRSQSCGWARMSQNLTVPGKKLRSCFRASPSRPSTTSGSSANTASR